MKHTMMLMVLAGALALTGCSKKSSNPVQPDTGSQQPAVTFTMHLESGTQGMIFVAVPSEDVTLTKVELSFPAQQFNDLITNPDPSRVFPKGQRITLNEYTGIDAGQQWILKFHGTVVQTGKPFVVTVNWTVV
jgi:hypothetical protein